VIRASPIVQTGETGSVLHPGNVRCYVWNVLSLISRPVIYTTNIKFITKSALISGIKVTEDLKYKQPTMGVVLDRPCFLVPAAHLAHVFVVFLFRFQSFLDLRQCNYPKIPFTQ